MKCVWSCLAAAVVAWAGTPLVFAQPYPGKPIRMVVALAGGSEGFARLVAQKAAEDFGQPVLVETQGGAGGAMGASMVAHSAPDGYTILFAATNSQLYHGFLSRTRLYDPVKDFTPITKIGEAILCIAANPSAPYTSFREFIQYAKSNPGRVSFGTSGVGTTHHLAAELIEQIAGIDMVHVPYKGGGQLLSDVVGGQIPVAFTILATAAPHVKSGKLRILALVNNHRYRTLPDIPSVHEMLPGFEMPPGWMGYFGPAGLPAPVLARLNAELVKVLNLPEIRARSDDFGFALGTSTPEELGALLKRDLATVAKIVKAANIQPE